MFDRNVLMFAVFFYAAYHSDSPLSSGLRKRSPPLVLIAFCSRILLQMLLPKHDMVLSSSMAFHISATGASMTIEKFSLFIEYLLSFQSMILTIWKAINRYKSVESMILPRLAQEKRTSEARTPRACSRVVFRITSTLKGAPVSLDPHLPARPEAPHGRLDE